MPNAMPTFVIHTNVSADRVSASMHEEVTALIAKALGKPLQYVAVHVVPGQLMSFGGTKEPCALAHLSSIGKISPAENKKYSALLSEAMNTHLGIAKDRMYIAFHNQDPANVGWNGSTFA